MGGFAKCIQLRPLPPLNYAESPATDDAELAKASVLSIASTSNQPFGTGYIIGDIQRKYLFIIPGLPRQSN